MVFPEMLEAYRLAAVLDRLVFLISPVTFVVYRLADNSFVDILLVLVPVLGAFHCMDVSVASPAYDFGLFHNVFLTVVLSMVFLMPLSCPRSSMLSRAGHPSSQLLLLFLLACCFSLLFFHQIHYSLSCFHLFFKFLNDYN